MNQKVLFMLLITALVMASCSRGPVPIEYGSDECHHCSMVIMDDQYAAEIVLKTGKAYKFDAIECMVRYMDKDPLVKDDALLFLITDHDHPGELINAGTGYVLHSKDLPSPMGMFLTGFSSEQAAKEAQNVHGGNMYSWDELLASFGGLSMEDAP
ncbi:MAG TPA: nitrous oxide reductase accessory protein NosL [Bacteroidales bacterium]|nr:nitrous oxide reductase accessory protein NosL [Bacteroidales bacterium]